MGKYLTTLTLVFFFSSHLHAWQNDTWGDYQKSRPVFLPQVFARAGAEYNNFDPGLLLPENRGINIAPRPYYYFDGTIGWDLAPLGINARFKNSFHRDNLSESYLNREDTVESREEHRTRERILGLLGRVTPFEMNSYERFGLYGEGQMRLFQTEITVDNPVMYRSDSESFQLLPGEEYVVNVIQRSYSAGLVVTSKKRYDISNIFGGKLASMEFMLGYRYYDMNAPFFVQQDNNIQSITSKTHGGFFKGRFRWPSFEIEAESFIGRTKFTNPDGRAVGYEWVYNEQGDSASISTFMRFYSRNVYTYSFARNAFVGISIECSSFTPIHRQAAFPNISLSVMWLGFWWEALINPNEAWILGAAAPVNLLSSYYLPKAMDQDTLYAEMSFGLNAGIRF